MANRLLARAGKNAVRRGRGRRRQRGGGIRRLAARRHVRHRQRAGLLPDGDRPRPPGRARPARRVHARQPGRVRDRRRRSRTRAYPRRRGTAADRGHAAPGTTGMAGRHRGAQLRGSAPRRGCRLGRRWPAPRRAIDQDRRAEPPPWPWVFPFDHAKLAGYRALVAVRLTRPGDALAAFTESLSAAQPAPKQRAVIMLEVATAARQDGTARRDSDRIDEAFRLGCEALGVGVTYSSERIIDRARRFRREYTGPATSYVREFDDQLRAALLLRARMLPHRRSQATAACPAPTAAPGRQGHPGGPRRARARRDRHIVPGRRCGPDLRPRGHRPRRTTRSHHPRRRIP